MVEGLVSAIWPDFRLTFDPSFKRKGGPGDLDPEPRLGAVLEAGKAHMRTMLSGDDDKARVECEEFHLFGDPEMQLLGIKPEN